MFCCISFMYSSNQIWTALLLLRNHSLLVQVVSLLDSPSYALHQLLGYVCWILECVGTQLWWSLSLWEVLKFCFLEIWVTVELCMKYIGCYYLQLTWGCLVFFSYRRAENAARRLSGEEPLPEEDPNNPIFKPLLEPSRLDSYLITNQVANYCGQVNGYAGPPPWSYGYFFIVRTGYWKKEISIIVFRGRVSICSLESTCVFHSCPL